MPQLRELLQQHISRSESSARAFSERTGISYPTVLALLHKGSVPRKPEHREALRRELSIQQDDWASIIAASQRDGIEIPREGPLTLRQLVLKALLAQGYTEQTFAKISGVPYATIMGVTRKGAIPRADTLATIAEKLGIEPSEMADAASRSRAGRAVEGFEPSGEVVLLSPAQDHANGDDAPPAPRPASGTPPFLAQLVADRISAAGLSVAAFARSHALPYLSLHRLLSAGVPPEHEAALQALESALGVGPDAFRASLQRSLEHPTPAVQPSESAARTPLQDALQGLVKGRNLTTKAFAELADLSVLTATKLLKHGDLPGRSSTHDKLRSLLQLSERDYEELVRRSRAEQATRLGTELPDEGPTLEELVQLLRSLGTRQRIAVRQFILGLGTSG